MDKNNIFVFCDVNNDTVDEEYSNKLIGEFRKLTGWKVEENTKIYNDLVKFSMGYSVKKRNVSEVAIIFCMANGIGGLSNA